VSCCLIVKNEIGQIESCLKSIRPHVAEIVVVDTGSTDGTFEVCAGYADIHERFSGCNDSEGRILDFSVARQRSFDLATQPWVMWVDGDDEVVGAEKIASLVASVRTEDPTLLMFPYEYSHNSAGDVTCLHYRERICRPKEAFHWVNPVHEVLTPRQSMNVIKTDDVRMIHRRSRSGKTIEEGRNLRILKAYYDRVGDSDVRQLYYLGLEYANAGDLRTSIEFHKKYISKSGWDDEKCLSCLEVAKHHQAFGEYDQAIEWALKATTVKENWGETYFSLGKSYYFLAQRGGPDARRNWERSVGFFRLGLRMPVTETILFVNPMERNLEVHQFLNLALNNINDVAGALESAMTGLKADPSDQGLRTNANLYEEHLARAKIEDGLLLLASRNKITVDTASFVADAIHGRVQVRASAAPSAQPDGPAQQPAPSPHPSAPGGPRSRLSFEQTVHPLDIVMYVGPGVEPWTPSTFGRTGLGGSETMAWEMARRLSAIGHRVRMYGDCPGMEGTFDGVDLLNHDRYRDLSCDVLITSRRPHVVDDSFGVKARARICWIHDVHCGDALTHARGLRIDRFLCLSRWHADIVRSNYPFLHPSQIIVTRNGVDLARFSPSGVPRNPHKMIYSSSPDRGLQTAITSMQAIRQRIPDAELHVFYGFKTWEASARANGSQDQLNIISLLRRLIEDGRQHGVHFHDRVDQSRLAREFMSSGVWGYPTWFTETSCQLAGSLIFTKAGMRPIENIKVGDLVLTHKGRFRKVTSLIKKDYDGPLYSFRRHKDALPFSLTGEHPVYVANFHKNLSSEGNRVYSRKNDRLLWKVPAEIGSIDYLTTPVMSGGSLSSVRLSDYLTGMSVKDGLVSRNHGHSVHSKVTDLQPLSDEFGYVLGLFAAEGCVSASRKRHGRHRWYSSVTFAFHEKEHHLVNSVRAFFGKGSVRKNSEHGVSLTFYSSPWANFLKNVIGTSKEKTVPSFLWDAPVEFQKSFLRGLLDGDGSRSIRPGRTGIGYEYRTYTSVSPSLAYGASQILSNLGLFPSMSYSKVRDAYTLTWSESPLSRQYRTVVDRESGHSVHCTRLDEQTVDHYSGKVYNFEVEEDRSYVTDRTVVHNCITAMEAQAAGLRIVTSPIAALTETVGPRGRMISGDWLSPEYKAAYVDAVVDAMSRTDDSDRAEISDYAARNFGLDSLALDWDAMLHRVVDEVERDIVVPYQDVR